MNISMQELAGEHVRIIPMDKSHIKGLFEAGNHKQIWTHLSKEIQTLEEMEALVEEALANKEHGTEFPFVITLRENDRIIGSTRFLGISPRHKGLEIGSTWLTPSVWRTPVNTECKYLLLKYCFEILNIIRVQFKTDDQNIRSQKAIERIGGVKEGVLRNHMIRKDGTFRHSVFFSVIESEWPSVKTRLESYLQRDTKAT
ncbi:GNAT family N-acetyltransferase [Fictibacillus fluitans]|uniref:GNAT family protein n=1 Tax=Fictibacillus fluitans TaxID=3058422 RepID=A0ABT8HYT0_9BACL|nr:GNAT family protein [Fictibacillus sp. NE201]MDN4525924.1 GNAT family protein [Fictibacillus sp. NE201]